MSRLGWSGILAIATAGVLLPSCSPTTGVFTCKSNDDCTGSGAGVCQDNGFCAFPDAQCDSGLRYGELAGGGFASMCVPEETPGSTGVGTTTPPMTSGSGDGPSSETGMASSTAATTDPISGSGTTSGSETTSAESSTSVGDTTGTTGDLPASCDGTLYEDDFEDGDTLPPHWTVVAPEENLVEVFGGLVRMVPTEAAGDQPTWIRSSPEVDFEGVWLMANIFDLAPIEGLQAIMSLTGTDGLAFDLVLDTDQDQLLARRSENKRFTSLALVQDIDIGETPWLRIRASEGVLFFEYGPAPDEMTTFLEHPSELATASGHLYIGVDNSFGPSLGFLTLEDTSVCAP